jgi:hypothetical protein
MITDGQAAGSAGRVIAGFLPLEALLFSLALVAALLLGAIIIVWVDHWRKRRDSRSRAAEADLETFLSLYAEGHLSREEMDRIRAHLGSRIEPDATQMPAPPPPPAKSDS